MIGIRRQSGTQIWRLKSGCPYKVSFQSDFFKIVHRIRLDITSKAWPSFVHQLVCENYMLMTAIVYNSKLCNGICETR